MIFDLLQVYELIDNNNTTKSVGLFLILCDKSISITIVPIISAAVGLFCFDKFEDNQTRKCSTFFPNVIVN